MIYYLFSRLLHFPIYFHLTYLFTFLLIYIFENRPIPFPGQKLKKALVVTFCFLSTCQEIVAETNVSEMTLFYVEWGMKASNSIGLMQQPARV